MTDISRGDVAVAVQLGPIAVQWSAENVSWAPDVIKDMQNRTMEMLKEGLAEAYQYGLFNGELTPEVLTAQEDGEDG